MKFYKINEIFLSLQGEGHFTGVPVVFIRFAGCNMSCKFCDTDFIDYTEMNLNEIINETRKCCRDESSSLGQIRNIVFTGGEPCMQLDDDIINEFINFGCHIQIETNGSLPLNISSLNRDRVFVTVSPKGSYDIKVIPDEIKAVYFDKEVLDEISLRYPNKLKYIQPLDIKGDMNTDKCIEYIYKSKSKWRLSLQTHKLINIK